MADKREDQGTGQQIGDAYRKAGPWLDASWQLSGSLAFWILVGYFLDRKLNTAPWLLLAGSVLGMIVGFYLFFRAVAALGKKRP
ncbi:MAG TPA: AtpZ/AtpI family protein [Myxococcales bacterium]|jgi:ATP synthase protein I|nr:AtpZ/AtpI family protein [Myxococcales bacterium]